MKKSLVFLKIKHAIETLDALKGYEFFSEANEEDFASKIESAVCSLDELEEIIERDEAYRVWDISRRWLRRTNDQTK